MADTPALGAGAARHGGSSPLPRTVLQYIIQQKLFVFLGTGLEGRKEALGELLEAGELGMGPKRKTF